MGKVGSSGGTVVVQKVGSGGEITLNIVVTVKLEDGRVSITADQPPAEEKKNEETKFVIPELKTFDLVNFE
jgi:hypothetical protein